MSEEKKQFILKRELDFGDILTSMSILVSVLGLGLTWLHDQSLKTQTYADEIRKSAAAVTGKLERWTQLSDLYFEDLMPSLGPASAEVVKSWNIEPANMNMYNALRKARFDSSKRIAEEQLEISYMELYRYVPELQPRFDQTINEIRTTEESSHDGLERQLQDTLRADIEKRKSGPETAVKKQIDIGNDLRGGAKAEKIRVHADIEKTTRELRGQMLCLINLPDERLRDPAKRKVAVAEILSMNGTECPATRR